MIPLTSSQAFCDENALDSLYLFRVKSRNVSSVLWEINPYVNPYDGQDRNDTVGYIFPEGQGQYTLTVTGNVGPGACSTGGSLVEEFTINVDRSYFVDVTASPLEDIYCEGDNGKFVGEVSVDSVGSFGSGVYENAHYSELFWDYYSSTFADKELNQQDNIERDYISDTIINGNDTTFVYSTAFTTVYDLIDSSDVYLDALSASKTREIGALNFGDSLIFRAEPQHCYAYNSILSDTILADSILQVRAEIEAVVEGENTYIVEDVVEVPLVTVTDNLQEEIVTIDATYSLFAITENDTIYERTQEFSGNFENIEVPDGAERVLFVMLMNQGVCATVDTALYILNYNLFIPDAISPNGDGSFDELYIQNIKKFPNNKVEIYNRWGSLLYEAKGYNNESVVWDGTHNGSVLPVASYYLIVDLGNGSDPISHTLSIFK